MEYTHDIIRHSSIKMQKETIYISVYQRLGRKCYRDYRQVTMSVYQKGKYHLEFTKIVSEYDQDIPQSQTADKPMAPRGRATNNHETPVRQTKQSNQLSLPNMFNLILCMLN